MKSLFLGVVGSLLFCSYATSVSATNIKMDTAVLRMLDKVTGRTSTVNARTGEEFEFGTLIIKPDVCETRPPEETPENSAFLEIDNIKPNGVTERIFSGWMFSSSPALSALDNSVYDIWVIKCTGEKIKELLPESKPVAKEKETAEPVVYIETEENKEQKTEEIEVIVE